MIYCLDSVELGELLTFYLSGVPLSSDTLIGLYQEASTWNYKLLCTTYSLSRFTARNTGNSLTRQKSVECFFALPDSLHLEIQECDDVFVECMLRRGHTPSLPLEDLLKQIALEVAEFKYEKSIRN